MQQFNYINASLTGKFFIEASAGTGKTFIIEQMTSRLIQEKGIPLDQILITTFTNAGARHVKNRIYHNLRKVQPQSITIQKALQCMEQAPIHTIHSFCYKMLTKNIVVPTCSSVLLPDKKKMEKIIIDLLRTSPTEQFSAAQVNRMLSSCQRNIPRFIQKIFSSLETPQSYMPKGHTYEYLHDLFLTTLQKLEISQQNLSRRVTSYYKTSSRTKELQPYVKRQIEALFSKDLETLIETSPSLFDILKRENAKKSSSSLDPIPGFEELAAIVREARSIHHIFSRFVTHVRNQLLLHPQEMPPRILEHMLSHIQSYPHFAQWIREQFQAVIIDEFQDTDPLQWEILSSLFLHSTSFFLLVGDPKQSIYAFRGTTIKTFLNAKSLFQGTYHLSYNYRSSPQIINHLNTLFSTPHLFSLSEKESFFTFQPSQSAILQTSSTILQDSLHIILSPHAQQEIFFSFLATQLSSMSLNDCAVLVKDRHQAASLVSYLLAYNIPAISPSTSNVIESDIFTCLILISRCIKNPPHNIGHLKQFLAQPIIGYPLKQLKLGSEDRSLSSLIRDMSHIPFSPLHACLTQLLSLSLPHSQKTFLETILLHPGGYEDLIQIIHALFSNPSQSSLEEQLKQLQKFNPEDHPYLKRTADPCGQSISILSSHMSKGLEFPIVFSLGVDAKTPTAFISDPLKEDQEKLRLLYVSATRAKQKLYLFASLCSSNRKKQFALGSASPIHILLTKLAFPHKKYEELYQTMQTTTLDTYAQVLQYHNIPFSIMTEPLHVQKRMPPEKPILIPPGKIPPLAPPKIIHSFSSLYQKDYTKTVPLFHNEMKESEELPTGHETGRIMHALLAKIIQGGWYYPWDKKIIDACIREEMKSSLLRYAQSIYELLYTAFFAQLFECSLATIHPNFALAEVPFCFCDTPHSYMHGYIDLAVFQNDNCYLVDWKFHKLLSYDPHILKKIVQQEYLPQASIYKKAVEKQIQKSIQGIIYFFLRGGPEGAIYI